MQMRTVWSARALISLPRGNHPDFAFLDEIKPERRGAAADVDLAGHHHRQGGGMPTGGNRTRIDLVLIEEGQQCGVARRTILGIADGLAGGIGKRLDRGIRNHKPIGIGRADHGAGDDAHWSALGKTANRGLDATAACDIHAAGNHGLVRLGATLGVEDLDHDAASLKNAGALAKLGDRSIPLAPLRHCYFQEVVGAGRCERQNRNGGKNCRKRCGNDTCHHGVLPAPDLLVPVDSS